ncbi:MAG: sodium:calcium antiporter [Chloroflexota bacterium]
MILDFIIVILCIVGLSYGATILVDASARLARRIGISELVIGLTVVAIGTSAPEFAVTGLAAIRGQADISVGNVVGSNIFNLGFILGSVVAVRAVDTSRKMVFRDGSILVAAALALLFFMRDLELQRSEGFILFGALILYVTYLIYQREETDEDVPEGEFQWLDVVRLIGGIGLIILAGQYLVISATSIARAWGVSEWVIAVTIIAAGTSAPEMATSLVAVLRGHTGISIGNLIGSSIFNLLGVLGLAGIIQTAAAPLGIDEAGQASLWMQAGMFILVVIFMRSGWRLSGWEGIALIVINLLRWVFDFSAQA